MFSGLRAFYRRNGHRCLIGRSAGLEAKAGWERLGQHAACSRITDGEMALLLSYLGSWRVTVTVGELESYRLGNIGGYGLFDGLRYLDELGV